MKLRFLTVLAAAGIVCLSAADSAFARGGNYVFAGGTRAQQAQVRAALEASSFNWSLIRQRITIHLTRGVPSHALPGHIWIDSRVLAAGRRSWAIAQHEYGHQVDFLLLDVRARREFEQYLGGRDWCWKVPGFKHDDYGCERFASTLSWAFWTSKDNVLRPHSARDEAGAMRPASFRRLLTAHLTRIYRNDEPPGPPLAVGLLPLLARRRKGRRS